MNVSGFPPVMQFVIPRDDGGVRFAVFLVLVVRPMKEECMNLYNKLHDTAKGEAVPDIYTLIEDLLLKTVEKIMFSNACEDAKVSYLKGTETL